MPTPRILIILAAMLVLLATLAREIDRQSRSAAHRASRSADVAAAR